MGLAESSQVNQASFEELLALCESGWQEIQSSILGTEHESLPIAVLARTLGFSWPSNRPDDCLKHFLALPSASSIIALRSIGRKKAHTILAVISHTWTHLQSDDSSTLALLSNPSKRGSSSPEDIVSQRWSEISKIALESPLAGSDIGNVAQGWGTRIPKSLHLKVQEVFSHETFSQFIDSLRSVGKNKRLVLAEVILNLWSDIDPDNAPRSSRTHPKTQANQLLESLGSSPGSVEVAETVMMAASIPESQREIILKRFGFGSDKPLTLEQIGELRGLTRERIRQLQAITMDNMRTHLVSASLCAQLSEQRLPEMIKTLKTYSQGGLISSDKLTFSIFEATDHFLLRIKFVRIEKFLKYLVLHDLATQVPDGWWVGPKLTVRSLERAQYIQSLLDNYDRPVPIRLVAGQAKLTMSETTIIAQSRGFRTEMGMVFKRRPTATERRCLFAITVAARHDNTLWFQPDLYDSAYRLDAAKPGTYRLFQRDLSAIPGLIVDMTGQFAVVNPVALSMLEENLFAGQIPVQSLSEPTEPEGPRENSEVEELNPESLENRVVEIVGRQRLARFEEITEMFCQGYSGSPSSIGPIMLSSSIIVRYAPRWYGLKGLELADSDIVALCNDIDLEVYIHAKKSEANLGIFPFWTAEMEYRWCRWAEEHAEPLLFESLLHVISPDEWRLPRPIMEQWKRKQKQLGMWSLDYGTPDFSTTVLDFGSYYGLIKLAISRGQLGYASIPQFIGWWSMIDRRAFSVLGVLVALGVLESADSPDVPHQTTERAGHIFQHMSQAYLEHPKTIEHEWRSLLAETIQSLDPYQSFGWFSARVLQDAFSRWTQSHKNDHI